MSDSWVGFRASPKKDPSKSLRRQEFNFASPLPIVKILKLITTEEGLEKWLVRFSKFDARLGAKLKFSVAEENYGGTFARIDIPKRIILLTELHGEIDLRLNERVSGTDLVLVISKTTSDNERADWESTATKIAKSFEEQISNV